ncbi:TetR/AcrR family transcriptional regulator [Mycobacterium sp. OTB74]|uniref:TetR/AcrR family transcriptional regulator n=1 Tax=Mycobacterium sp. OTB74 TaxID=1853452 RepID=UPI002473CA05|nr:TetR/AcrR family transcriptional regulator [Mycobacterium sp. OTB74]MDH6242781.1 AcrR family transcriptional regulator [Mycobacterium sp. OTB74]
MRSRTDRRPTQRSDHRREAILDALDRWLQQSELETVNIAEIAREAGVGRSAFYFYFENKAAAVAALTERMIDETFAVQDVFVSSAAPPTERIGAMLDGLLDTWQRHRHVFRAMLDARGASPVIREIWDSARESFVSSIADMIRADRAAGRARDGVDATVLAMLLLEFNDRLLERLSWGGPLTQKQLREGAADIWLATIYGSE